MTILGGLEFLSIFLGVTSELDNFYGLFLQIKCMCSVMKLCDYVP